MQWALLFWVLVGCGAWFMHRVDTLTKDRLASFLWLSACGFFVVGFLAETLMRGGRLPVGP